VIEHLPEAPHDTGLEPRASVFDDDFFREPKEPARIAATPPVIPIVHAPEPVVEPEPEVVVAREVVPEQEPTLWPEARIPSFAGYAGGNDFNSESDELDIPAFLRKKH
jgi:hypothetical protein